MESKQDVENVLKQRFFVKPTEYPCQNGFLDYGPPLTQIKKGILSEFRKIFIDENTYEIEPSHILPYDVLKNSGHVDRFCDIVLTDDECIVRADHFIEDILGERLMLPANVEENFAMDIKKVEDVKIQLLASEGGSKVALEQTLADKVEKIAVDDTKQLSSHAVEKILSQFECVEKQVSELTKKEIDFVVFLHNLRSPTGKVWKPAADHNLIFKLSSTHFLRPELAQSQFVAFRRLYEMNYEKLPFSSFCVGKSYRNEISARGGMLRTKEFEQAEIEYFSEDGRHPAFCTVKETSVRLLASGCAEVREMPIIEAHEKKIISSEAICYFIGKAQEFLLRIGFPEDSLRFRQHNPSEMAHYASDCWDAEIRTMSGWVECAGIADRGTFDLSCHSKNINTTARRMVPPYSVFELQVDRKEIGKKLRARAKDFEEYLKTLSQADIEERRKGMSMSVEFEGQEYTVGLTTRRVDSESFFPKVIEPSFGVSRILYSLVEKSFVKRDDRIVLQIKPFLAYIHCVIGYLKYMDGFGDMIEGLKRDFRSKCLRFKVNERTCSLGRKYSSADEIGVPFFVVFDFETIGTKTVTIRERDSTNQIRVPVESVASIISDLVSDKTRWDECYENFKFTRESQ